MMNLLDDGGGLGGEGDEGGGLDGPGDSTQTPHSGHAFAAVTSADQTLFPVSEVQKLWFVPAA